MIYSSTYQTPIGPITLCDEQNALVGCYFGLRTGEVKETPLLKQAAQELAEYLGGTRRVFDVPLNPSGTDFQKKVWQALVEIPYGQTASYQEIAARAGNVKACRAVGMANNRNPISIFIPCHRVIGKKGQMVGYGGGLGKKIALLKLECVG